MVLFEVQNGPALYLELCLYPPALSQPGLSGLGLVGTWAFYGFGGEQRFLGCGWLNQLDSLSDGVAAGCDSIGSG